MILKNIYSLVFVVPAAEIVENIEGGNNHRAIVEIDTESELSDHCDNDPAEDLSCGTELTSSTTTVHNTSVITVRNQDDISGDGCELQGTECSLNSADSETEKIAYHPQDHVAVEDQGEHQKQQQKVALEVEEIRDGSEVQKAVESEQRNSFASPDMLGVSPDISYEGDGGQDKDKGERKYDGDTPSDDSNDSDDDSDDYVPSRRPSFPRNDTRKVYKKISRYSVYGFKSLK